MSKHLKALKRVISESFELIEQECDYERLILTQYCCVHVNRKRNMEGEEMKQKMAHINMQTWTHRHIVLTEYVQSLCIKMQIYNKHTARRLIGMSSSANIFIRASEKRVHEPYAP